MINRKSGPILRAVKTKGSAYWEGVRKQRSLSLFHGASRQVPAYKDFLKKHKIDPNKIKKFEDLDILPHVTKENYLRKYSLPDLSWGGTLDQPLVYTSTSGSTGNPVYFHRSFQLDWQSSILHEMYYSSGQKSRGPTLVIVCFGMGVWIGGIITYQAFRLMKERGHNLSLITPGINKEEIFRALKNLSPFYSQTVLVGYPPFIKDVIDESEERGINLKKLGLRILCAAEPFDEKFRRHLIKKSGADSKIGVTNIYGTADLGTMAIETPLSILIRETAIKKPDLFKELFGGINKMPTLCQYIPDHISFDATKHGDILITGDNSIPLIRYAIGDHGGTYSADTLEKKLTDLGQKIDFIQHLPFVYVYERADLSTTLYGLQIYPESLREIFLQQPFVNYCTGKFTLETRFNQKQDQYLFIHIELRKNKKITDIIRKALLKFIVLQLENKNSEFRELHKMLGRRAWPKIVFWPYEDQKHFKVGIKQKWVKNN